MVDDIFQVGDQVVLGEHQTVGVQGKPCDKNWNSSMDKYVGKTATITYKVGAMESSGSQMYTVDIDGGLWCWRGINMTLVSKYQTKLSSACPATKEYDCKQCGKKNDLTAKKCWWCETINR